MAYTLNTGHALYGNLIELIGVQGGALVSHKTARTFTPETGSSFGTGTYGEHFSSVENNYATKGVAFTPGVAIPTNTTTSYTVMLVFNSIGAVTSGYHSVYLSRPAGGTMLRSPGKNSSGNITTLRANGAAVGTGARMLTLCRIGETAEKVYNNKVKDIDATGLSNDWADSGGAQATFMGGWNSQFSMSADLVWAAFFDKELSSTEIGDLYDSLGASNAFALVSSGDTTAPTLTSASVSAVATTTATGNVTTNEANGTLYSIVSTSATAPSAAQIQAGQNHTGAAAVWSSNQAVSSTGAKTFSITGLTVGTTYYTHFQHKDAANNNSTVVTSTQFTTTSNSSLLLDAGVYSITGVSLTLDGAVTYTLPLDTGAYNVSSVAATFGVSFPLDAGIYNLNGNAVTLTQSTISSSTYSLLLGDGVYTITGRDVLTPVSTKLLIESGVYTVLGRNVLLQSSTEPTIVSSGGHTISVSIKIGI